MHNSICHARKKLGDIKLVPGIPFKTDSTYSVESSSFFIELMDRRGKAGAMALLVHLSPATGEPVSFHVNNRKSQLSGMNTKHVVKNISNNTTFTFRFLDDLRADRLTDNSVLGGNKAMHYFMCGVNSHLEDSTDIRDLYEQNVTDDYLQTLSTVKFEKNDGTSTAPHVLLVGDQRVRDITIRDINELHYLLNIPTILPKTFLKQKKGKTTVGLFEMVFEKLNQLPLYDAQQLRCFLAFECGIPLFRPQDGYPEDECVPIYKQWTYLSYFLQMCSAVTMSPIEGGHRTWEFIKYYTGSPFANHTPQPFEPIPVPPAKIVFPDVKLEKQGLSQSRYQFYFWQRYVSKKAMINRTTANLLQRASLALKQHEDVTCVDTNLEFCRLAMEAAGKSVSPLAPFTLDIYFRNFAKGVDIINARLKSISEAIWRLAKHKMPLKKVWDDLPDKIKNNYQKRQKPRHEMSFTQIVRGLVSKKMWRMYHWNILNLTLFDRIIASSTKKAAVFGI